MYSNPCSIPQLHKKSHDASSPPLSNSTEPSYRSSGVQPRLTSSPWLSIFRFQILIHTPPVLIVTSCTTLPGIDSVQGTCEHCRLTPIKTGHALNRESQLPELSASVGATSGIWAPALREHNGTFYLLTTMVHDKREQNDSSRWDNVSTAS